MELAIHCEKCHLFGFTAFKIQFFGEKIIFLNSVGTQPLYTR